MALCTKVGRRVPVVLGEVQEAGRDSDSHGLDARGIAGIIVSEEPIPPNADWDPDEKVNKFLDMSDVFVALATPDDELSDGTVQTRQNIVDEIARSRQRPGLDRRSTAYKAKGVTLHSNINPAHERLDLDDPTAIVPSLIRQMEEWGVLDSSGAPQSSAPLVSQPTTPSVTEFVAGLGLGDHDAAAARVYVFSLTASLPSRRAMVEALVSRVEEGAGRDHEEQLIAASALEAFGRLKPTLVPMTIAERLSHASDFSARASSAHLIWDRVLASPGEVPVPVLGRLLRPSREDWYVWAPAMAAAKELLLVRRSARVIFDLLLHSPEGNDRHTLASALRDVARVNPAAVPGDIARELLKDSEDEVRTTAHELVELLGDHAREEFSTQVVNFGL